MEKWLLPRKRRQIRPRRDMKALVPSHRVYRAITIQAKAEFPTDVPEYRSAHRGARLRSIIRTQIGLACDGRRTDVVRELRAGKAVGIALGHFR